MADPRAVASAIDARLQELLALDDDQYAAPEFEPIRPFSVERIASWFAVTDEALIDMGHGTPEMIARDEARRAEREARWRALPWRVRFMRKTVRPRLNGALYRLAHAARALRGIDCERDDDG